MAESPRPDSLAPRYDFAVVILGAGKGQESRSLRRATLAALAAGAAEVIVVTGRANGRNPLLRIPRIRLALNDDASAGVSNSIRIGVSKLRQEPEAIVLVLANRIAVTAAHIRSLARHVLQPGGAPIAASAYDGVIGAPCAFARALIPQLKELQGIDGARQIIRRSGAEVAVHSMPKGNVRSQPESTFDGSLPTEVRPFKSLLKPSVQSRAPPCSELSRIL